MLPWLCVFRPRVPFFLSGGAFGCTKASRQLKKGGLLGSGSSVSVLSDKVNKVALLDVDKAHPIRRFGLPISGTFLDFVLAHFRDVSLRFCVLD